MLAARSPARGGASSFQRLRAPLDYGAAIDARRERLSQALLYLVVEAGAAPLLDAALRGGVDVVQLRDQELAEDELLAAARVFRRACDEHDALFVLNDRADLVVEANADGVHVGQHDLPVVDARRLVGDERLVGLSISAREQLDATADADYLGVGAVFGTPTKPDATVTGLELVAEATARASVPVFAIGGIDETNVGDVVRAGVRRIAVVRAIRDADEPEIAARRLRAYLES
jgi:thiamine-phosphate pyrophosphorylase